jgi:hypothetical protein
VSSSSKKSKHTPTRVWSEGGASCEKSNTHRLAFGARVGRRAKSQNTNRLAFGARVGRRARSRNTHQLAFGARVGVVVSRVKTHQLVLGVSTRVRVSQWGGETPKGSTRVQNAPRLRRVNSLVCQSTGNRGTQLARTIVMP